MKTLSLIALWAVSIAGAFYAGIHIGVRENYFAMSQYEAASTVGDLKIIEKSPEDLKETLNTKLDAELATYTAYMDSNWKWLWPERRTDKYIRFAATYRAAHPFEHTPGKVEHESPEWAEFSAARSAENKRNLERVLQAYAEK